MKKIITTVKIAIILSIILLELGNAQAQTRAEKIVTAEVERITGDKFPTKTKTPKGAIIYAVKKPKKEMLKAIDEGLTELFEVAKKNKYKERLNYSDYTVYIAKADRTKDSDGNFSPDIAVPAAQYKGTVFDKGGYIYAAGIVIARDPCVFAIPEHSKGLDRVKNVARYEGEHLILYHNDRKRYEETRDHSKGGAHPIMQ